MKQQRRNRRSVGIFADLVRAIDWYDVSLQGLLVSKNLQSLNRTQSVMMIHIAEGVTRPSEIGHEMGTTRQNIHAMAKPLLNARIIELVPDPDDGRSKQYAFCDDSSGLRDAALQMIRYLDRKLGERIGKDELKALKRTLSRDWGDAIIRQR